MRSSILSRSVVAVATLAIGSVALGAVPANAAPAGVTRDQVLTAVDGFRTAQASSNESLSPAAARALKAIIVAGCDVSEADGDEINQNSLGVQITPAGDDAQGLMVGVEIDRDFSASSYCLISAFAATNTSFRLSGTASITGQRMAQGDPQGGTKVVMQSTPLSGDVVLSTSIDPDSAAFADIADGSVVASAAGNATKTTKVTTSTKVKDKKSKAEKKAAKKSYNKRLKAAKKSYAKALDKAGSSKSKKADAKKAYKAKRASAKAKFKYGIAGYKIVKKKGTVTDIQPFSVTTAPLAP